MADPTTPQDPGAALVAAARLLVGTGVLSASGHGNASIRVADRELVLTSRSSLVGLEATGTARVDFDGRVHDGRVEPANLEIVAMHRVVYEALPEVRAVVHTHSPFATAFALAHRPLPSRYESTIRYGLVDDVPVAPWGPRGSRRSIEQIRATIAEHGPVIALLLANHGLLAFGRTIDEAARLAIALEEAAAATYRAEALGGARPLPADALDAVEDQMAAFGMGDQVRRP